MLVISNGYGKFHLSVLAAEFSKRGELDYFLTGTYPKGPLRDMLLKLPIAKSGRIQRLLQRKEEVAENTIRSFWRPETLYHASRAIRNFASWTPAARMLQENSYQSFGSEAARFLLQNGRAGIYHYRAGYGGRSVAVAKDLGMVALCDHSIAHPQVLEYMIGHAGQFPSGVLPPPSNPVERLILADIEAADHVLVNSDFVKKTFQAQVSSADRVSVIYLGVDEQFISSIPERENLSGSAEPRLMFAGGYSDRKGAPQLVQAMSRVHDLPWRFQIAANLDSASTEVEKAFLNDPRVDQLGFLSRRELAGKMAQCDIFVFPSLAEGSARVVFEALAAGCYVITTENTGSVVVDGIHGAIVPVGDVDALEAAIRTALANMDRVREIGAKNASMVQNEYRQWHYAENVAQLYTTLSRPR